MLPLLSITVDINPELGQLGPFLITWHGVFTTLGIAVAVVLAAYFATRRGVLEDDVYNVALWAVPGGIVGARLLYVLEHLGDFRRDWSAIFALNEGGISIYGGLILGAAVGFAFAYLRHKPVRRIADAAALGMLMGQAVGRIGDFINGEQWAKPTHLPWAVCYTNPKALVYGPPFPDNSCGPYPFFTTGVHPVASLYEPLLLLCALAFCLYLRYALKKEGYVFWAYVLCYSVIRFGLGTLRTNEAMLHLHRLPLAVPQLIAIITAVIALVAIGLLRNMRMAAVETSPSAAAGAPAAVRPRVRSS